MPGGANFVDIIKITIILIKTTCKGSIKFKTNFKMYQNALNVSKCFICITQCNKKW